MTKSGHMDALRWKFLPACPISPAVILQVCKNHSKSRIQFARQFPQNISHIFNKTFIKIMSVNRLY